LQRPVQPWRLLPPRHHIQRRFRDRLTAAIDRSEARGCYVEFNLVYGLGTIFRLGPAGKSTQVSCRCRRSFGWNTTTGLVLLRAHSL